PPLCPTGRASLLGAPISLSLPHSSSFSLEPPRPLRPGALENDAREGPCGPPSAPERARGRYPRPGAMAGPVLERSEQRGGGGGWGLTCAHALVHGCAP